MTNEKERPFLIIDQCIVVNVNTFLINAPNCDGP